MQKYPMTVQGEESLRQELQQLKHVDRPKIIKAIAEARAHGDLKENAEYHAAKEQQSFLEGRISDIEAKLSMAEVIDIKKIPNRGRVIFGVIVTLALLDEDKEVTYHIVGDDEADLTINKISIQSPIARALIGKSVGDEVTVSIPSGRVEYEIVDVKHE